jgi:hypothetical protein
MSEDKDLDEFRLKWCEELQTNQHQNSSKSSSDCGFIYKSDKVKDSATVTVGANEQNVTLSNRSCPAASQSPVEKACFNVKKRARIGANGVDLYPSVSASGFLLNPPCTPDRDKQTENRSEDKKVTTEVVDGSCGEEKQYNPFSMVDRLLSTPETFRTDSVNVGSNGKRSLSMSLTCFSSSQPIAKRQRCQTEAAVAKPDRAPAIKKKTEKLRSKSNKPEDSVEKDVDGTLVDILIADLVIVLSKSLFKITFILL